MQILRFAEIAAGFTRVLLTLLLVGGMNSAWAESEQELRLKDSVQLDPSAQFELVFRASGLFKRTRELRPEELTRAERLRGDSFGLVRALGTGVWNFLTQAPNAGEPPHPISSDDFEFIKSRWATLPMRVCVENCPCAGTDVMGCGLTAARDAFMATVLLLHPCALESESPQVCEKLAKGLRLQKRGPIAAEAVRGMATGMVEAGLAQLWGIEAFRANRKLATRASDLMKRASFQLDALSQTCPGPYSRAGQSYLESVGALDELPSTWTDCAQRLVAPFRDPDVRSACSQIAEKAAWEKWISRGVLVTPIGARRCDGVCELATGCFGADSPRIPRFLMFGRDAYLSLPRGSCEGMTPQQPDEFFQSMLARFVRSGALENERETCLRAIRKSYSKSRPASDSTASAAPKHRPESEAPSARGAPASLPTLPPLPSELDLPAGI